jgi:hypothetical protein
LSEQRQLEAVYGYCRIQVDTLTKSMSEIEGEIRSLLGVMHELEKYLNKDGE